METRTVKLQFLEMLELRFTTDVITEFLRRLYSNFIIKLTKIVTKSRQNTFNVSCGDGQYVYFAIPTRFGKPTFSVGGFSGGFIKVSTLDFTNKFGYTEPYDILKSENSNLGNIAVVVG